MPRLWWDSGVQLGQLRLSGVCVSRRERPTAVAVVGLREEDDADLEESEIGEPPGEVAPGSLKQAGKERPAQHRHLRIQRIRQAHRWSIPAEHRVRRL